MAEEKKKDEEKKEEKATPKDNIVTTKHSVKIGGKTLKYTVTTGTMVLKEEVTEKENEVEKPRAQIFFTAYTPVSYTHLVAREMTKMYEEFWRGDINGAIEYFKSKEPRGEFTLVIEGKKKEERTVWAEAQLIEVIKHELQAGKSAKEISAELAEQSGWNKKEVYALVNQLK